MWIKTPHMADPLMNERIVNAINSELTAKRWQLVTESADVGIAAHIATKKEHTLETFYSGFGGGWGWRWWGGGFGTATTHVETFTVGTLVVDMFDCRTRQLIWRGTASGRAFRRPEEDLQKAE